MTSEYNFTRYWLQEWPLPTMSKEDFDKTKGCPHRSHDCKCFGMCPVRLEREARAAEYDRKRRDWRHRRG